MFKAVEDISNLLITIDMDTTQGSTSIAKMPGISLDDPELILKEEQAKTASYALELMLDVGRAAGKALGYDNKTKKSAAPLPKRCRDMLGALAVLEEQERITADVASINAWAMRAKAIMAKAGADIGGHMAEVKHAKKSPEKKSQKQVAVCTRSQPVFTIFFF